MKSLGSKTISIFGNPGTGKSTLADAIVQKIGGRRAARIRADHYLKSRGNISLEKYLRGLSIFDWELIERDLTNPVGTIITTPIFDFTNFQRISTHGGKPFIISKINIIDAIMPYPKSDLSIIIELDDMTRKLRVIEREKEDTTWKQFVINNWESCRYNLEQFEYDIQLDGKDTLESNMDRVVTLLENRNWFE